MSEHTINIQDYLLDNNPSANSKALGTLDSFEVVFQNNMMSESFCLTGVKKRI